MFSKQMNEKQYNQRKIKEAQYLIWDWNFKVFKNRVERERYRVEYDQLKAKLDLVNNQMKDFPPLDAELINLDRTDNKLIAEKKAKWNDEQNRIDDEKVKMEAELKKYEMNMKQFDIDLNGALPSVDNPEGVPGILQTIDALRDLVEVYKAYTKSL